MSYLPLPPRCLPTSLDSRRFAPPLAAALAAVPVAPSLGHFPNVPSTKLLDGNTRCEG